MLNQVQGKKENVHTESGLSEKRSKIFACTGLENSSTGQKKWRSTTEALGL